MKIYILDTNILLIIGFISIITLLLFSIIFLFFFLTIRNYKEKIRANLNKEWSKKFEVREEEIKKENEESKQKLIDTLDKKNANIISREKVLDTQENLLIQKEKLLNEERKNLSDRRREQLQLLNQLEKERENLISQAEKLVNFSRKDIEFILKKDIKEKIKAEINKIIDEHEKEVLERKSEITRNIIANSLESYVRTNDINTLLSHKITLKGDIEKNKGRIIGKEGKNIKSFQSISGTELVFTGENGQNNIVVISSFDPIRRYTAVLTMNKLLETGYIQPQKIEEIWDFFAKNMNHTLKEIGETTLRNLKIDITSVHPELIRSLGKLRFRTSYGQNVLDHSIEVARIGASIATEIGLDSALVLRAGLFHDIGKSVPQHESKGSHIDDGIHLAQKYGEGKVVINAIRTHHEQVLANDVYSIVVKSADILSASRIGARKDNKKEFAEKMEDIENKCKEIEGVEKAYVFQAGRQIRVIINPEKISDEKLYKLRDQVKNHILEDVKVIPGNIYLILIREKRLTCLIDKLS